MEVRPDVFFFTNIFKDQNHEVKHMNIKFQEVFLGKMCENSKYVYNKMIFPRNALILSA